MAYRDQGPARLLRGTARLGVGMSLGWAGVEKVADPAGFAAYVGALDMVEPGSHAGAIRAAGVAVGAWEVGLACCLMVPWVSRAAATLSFGTLMAYTALLLVTPEARCPCLDGLGALLGSGQGVTLARNGVLLGASAALAFLPRATGRKRRAEDPCRHPGGVVPGR